jgi:hypothetical protein
MMQKQKLKRIFFGRLYSNQTVIGFTMTDANRNRVESSAKGALR